MKSERKEWRLVYLFRVICKCLGVRDGRGDGLYINGCGYRSQIKMEINYEILRFIFIIN